MPKEGKMSKGPFFRELALRTLVGAVLVGVFSVQVGVTPALALGSPQIVSVNPGSGAQVGATVCIRVRIDNDPEYRAMRIRFGSEGWQEGSEYEFERCFGTGHLAAGWYTIRVEAASLSDTSWSSPTSTETSYQLTAAAQPTQPPSPPRGPNVSVVNLSPGGSAEVGTQVSIHIVVDSSNPGAVRTTVSCGGVQHVEHTVPEFTTTWYTETCSPGNQSVRVCARDVNDPNWANASCADRGYSLWEEPSSPRPTANLWADSESIQAGQCTTLHWTTEDATRVELDGEVVEASGQRQVCPTITKHYNLRATGDGGQADDNVSVYVSSAPPQAQVVDSFHTGDVIDIDGNIYVIVDRQRRHVPNPETLDALGIPRSWVNNRGYTASELRTILEGPDVPDVLRDPSGFQAFKNWIFPNTTPIVPATATPRATGPSEPSGRPWVSINQSSVQAGSSFTASWGGLNVTQNDWITIHQAGESDESYAGWDYVSRSSGTITLIAPTETGWYDLQLYREWVKIATSERFQVIGGVQATSEPVQQQSSPEVQAEEDPDWCDWFVVGSFLCPPSVDAREMFGPQYRGQCTYYVAENCPSVLAWLQPGANGGQWDNMARQYGGEYGVRVLSRPDFSVSGNIIAVWEGGMCGAPAEGHVARVTGYNSSTGTMSVDESNWGSYLQPGHRDGVRVDSTCMSFIHVPDCRAAVSASSDQQQADPSFLESLRNFFTELWRRITGG